MYDTSYYDVHIYDRKTYFYFINIKYIKYIKTSHILFSLLSNTFFFHTSYFTTYNVCVFLNTSIKYESIKIIIFKKISHPYFPSLTSSVGQFCSTLITFVVSYSHSVLHLSTTSPYNFSSIFVARDIIHKYERSGYPITIG